MVRSGGPRSCSSHVEPARAANQTSILSCVVESECALDGISKTTLSDAQNVSFLAYSDIGLDQPTMTHRLARSPGTQRSRLPSTRLALGEWWQAVGDELGAEDEE
jgi:hypothetical protein